MQRGRWPALLLVLGAITGCTSLQVTISNREPRIDHATGNPVNAHSGNIVRVGTMCVQCTAPVTDGMPAGLR